MVVSNKKSAVKELLCLVGNSLSWRVVFRRVLHQLEVPEYGHCIVCFLTFVFARIKHTLGDHVLLVHSPLKFL